MKAITVRCPDCRAQIHAVRGLKECTYCGASIFVDDGSGLGAGADTPERLEPRTGQHRAQPGSGPPAKLVLAGSLLLLAVTLVGLALSLRETADEASALRSDRTSASSGQRHTATKSQPTMEFEAHHPVLANIDGDAIEDILGYFEGEDDAFYAAAISGADGSLLWRSDAIPGLAGGAEPQVFVGTSVLLAATNLGELTTYSRRDGGTLWTIRLAEVVKEVYELEGDAARIVLADKSQVRVGLKRGALEAATGAEGMHARPLPSMNRRAHRAAARLETAFGSRTFGDVDAGTLVIADDDSFQVSLGKRRKGTGAPMLVRYEGTVAIRSQGKITEVWRTPVAGVEPLKARMPLGTGGFLHANKRYACAAYCTIDRPGNTPARVAAFDMKDGRRLWDHPMPGQAILNSVTVVGERVYIATWKGLTVIDAQSGATLFAVDELPLG